MIIDTERLRLRRFREFDADDVHLYASDPEVCVYTDFGPNTWDETVNYVEEVSADTADPFTALAITLRGSNSVVGAVGAITPKGEEPDERPHVRELGWVLRKDLWGRGIITEAAGALVQELRLNPALTRLEARCRPENKASKRVMEKLGMTFEWHLERDYECKGVWVDSLLYSLALTPTARPGQFLR